MESINVPKRERVWLVATSSLWVAGFKGLFSDPCGVEAVALTLVEAIALKGPEIVLIDAGASTVNGRVREVMIQLHHWAPNLRPIVMSHEEHEDEFHIELLIRSGAKGYLSASVTVEEFRAALENVRDGSIWAPRKVLSRLVLNSASRRARPHATRGSHHGPVEFTPREDQVIRMLVAGKSNVEIGASLGIDPATVKAHLGRIMRKAGVGNRVELTVFALAQTREQGPGRERTDQSAPHEGPHPIA